MELEYYLINPKQGICEAVVSYPIVDPFVQNRKDTQTIRLDQKIDLLDKPDYTDQDVVDAIETKAQLAKGTISIPVSAIEPIL